MAWVLFAVIVGLLVLQFRLLRGTRSTDAAGALTTVMLALAVLWLTPALWVLVTSLKQDADIIRTPPEWIPWPATLEHYHEVLLAARARRASGGAFLNSGDRLGGAHADRGLVSAMAAYPLAACALPAAT